MSKNRISHKSRVIHAPPTPSVSQNSFSTQQNFASINELSSFGERQKAMPTISNIRKKYLMQSLINRLKFLVAPHAAPSTIKENWNEQYKFGQNDNEQGTERQTLFEEIKYKYKFWHIIMMIQAICVTILFWTCSTEVVFLPKFKTSEDDNIFSFSFKIGPCLLIICKLILKQLFIFREKALNKKHKSSLDPDEKEVQEEQNSQTNYEQFFQNLEDHIKNIIYCGACVAYLFIHVVSVEGFRELLQAFMSVVFFLKVYNLKQNLQKIYSYVESKDYKNQFRIVVLFFVVVGTCHLMALVLYAITYMYPHKNWVNAVDKVAVRQNTWLSHYTCSIYFTITTMATVGYGDFTPVETGEMFLVSFIQLFGTALFGYMINVVGLSVVEINKKNEEFDNNISTINRLQSHYQISRQLCQKFKDDIVKNQSVRKQTPLSEVEQTEFFKMIQNSLKQEFILETNIKVIKKSIFFLTHFTVNFQNQIALKLIRKIYKKNEKVPLVDLEDAERCMFIINSGSVDIDIIHQSSNVELRKYIKNISPQEGKPTLNVFGYSALILNRNIDLQGITKDTSVIYLLKRKDVLECMDKNMLDFQGISELRQRMLHYKNLNYIEAPTLMDLDKHYVPNIYFIIKKKKTINQQRDIGHKRRNRKCRIKVITLKNYQYRTMMCIDLEESSLEQVYSGSKICKSLQVESQKYNTSLHLVNYSVSSSQNQAQIMIKLDQWKNFENFMKKSNISHILPKYHEYLRQCRHSRKMMQKVSNMLNEDKGRSQKVKYMTYTEGINTPTFRAD